MYRLYYTKSGAAWSSKVLIWQSDMAIDPDKYGIYDMKCSVEVNKAAELRFVVTKSCPAYDLFSKERSVLTLIMDDDKTIFRGVVKLIETDYFFQRTITANSDLIYLSDSVFEPHGTDIEEKPLERFKRIINHHNVEMQGDPEKQIQPGNFTFENGADDIEKYAKNGGYKDTMSQLQNDFKDFYGFYQIRYSDDYSKKWLDYTETTGKSTSQDIKFAVNIEDYQFKDTVDDLFSMLIPVGSDNLVLTGQNEQRTVNIRMPDQSKRAIEVYVVDKYIKIVEALQKYGYIYQAESFTVDSNNIGKSGTNGRIGGGGSGGQGARTGYEFTFAYRGGTAEAAGKHPAAEGLYVYHVVSASYDPTTDTDPVNGRDYYARSRPTLYKVTDPGAANPRAKGWYEYRNGRFEQTLDTSVVSGKTYYSKTKESGGGGGDTYTYTRYVPRSTDNPSELGLYYWSNGVRILATETSPVPGRTYYKRSGGGGGGGGGGGEPTYVSVSVSPTDNPKALGLYEKRAFTISKYQKTNDTTAITRKRYYEQRFE